MALTLGTLLILFFLLPGLVFRKAFFILPFDKRFTESNTLSEIGIVLILSILLQWLGISLGNCFHNVWYKECQDAYNFIYHYTFLGLNSSVCKSSFDKIDLESLITYQLFLWALGMFFGFLLNSIVRYFKLDRKYRTLRFGNSWYYYFSGEAVEFPGMDGNAKEIDCIFVDTLVKSEGKEILYIGVLSEYELSTNGGLKSFALKGAKRRYLDSDSEKLPPKEKAERDEAAILNDYYTIPSNLFVIPYNDNVLNINFRYYSDNEDDVGASDNTGILEKIIQILSLTIILIILLIGIRWVIKRLFGKKK